MRTDLRPQAIPPNNHGHKQGISKMSMLKLLTIVVGVAVFVGCSQDDRDEIAERGGNAWSAIKGESKPGEKTPRIVKEQQRKERIRQNNTWTPENRAQHPVEYCQALLETLQQHSRNLEARVHETSCAIAAVKRTIGDNDSMEQNLKNFLDDAKKTYKECEAANKWPAKVGGYTLSREKTQEKIVDAAQKLSEMQLKVNSKKNQLTALEKKLKRQQDEQKKIAKYREQVQSKINDIRTEKVINGDDGIVASLAEISDNLKSLGTDYDDPKIEDLVQPDEKKTREELFKKIMSE